MTGQQIKDVCQKYDVMLAEMGAEYIRESIESRSLNHLRWMCREVSLLIDLGKIDKAYRWLGFIQGALWAMEIVPIETLKSDNRSKQKDEPVPKWLDEWMTKFLNEGKQTPKNWFKKIFKIK